MTFWEVVKQGRKTFLKASSMNQELQPFYQKKLRKDICSVKNIEESHFECLKTKRAKIRNSFWVTLLDQLHHTSLAAIDRGNDGFAPIQPTNATEKTPKK